MPFRPITIEKPQTTSTGFRPVSDMLLENDVKAQAPEEQPNNESDTKSAETYGASFPAKTGEGILPATAKTIGNIPSSSLNLAKGIGSVALHPIDTITGLQKMGAGAIEKGLGAITGRGIDTEETQTFDAVGQFMKDRYGSAEALQRTATNDPVGLATDILSLISGGAGTVGKLGTVEKAIGTVGREGINLTKDIGTLSTKPIKPILNKVSADIIKPITSKISAKTGEVQTALSRANVPEKFETSVQRLATPKPNAPLVTVESPLAKYDKYLEQEQKFKTDIKADTAISKVGEDIGNEFEKVVGQRRQVGKTMGDEIKKIGTKKIDVTESFPKFEQELADSGVTYSNGKVQLSDTSKITSQDANMLDEYISKLNKLGANPSAAQLDAFLSRVPQDLNVYKASKNITNVTNGERMIKGNLRELTNNLVKDPSLAKYAEARKQYADLSEFLDEGSTYLGKKTQSGDYAKDASIAKSSVQSILNNGKKDWLLKLEDLTGYQAVDNSMLALQAMKDSGNFRGLSLLETLSSGEAKIPTKANILQKGVEFGIKKGKEALVGDQTAQTRRMIMENMRGKNPTYELGEIQNLIESNKTKNISKPISSTIPQTQLKSNTGKAIQSTIKKIEETPNKQGGFVALPKSVNTNKIAKLMKPDDYEILRKSVDEPSNLEASMEAQDLIEQMIPSIKGKTVAEKTEVMADMLDAYRETNIAPKLAQETAEKAKMVDEALTGKSPSEVAKIVREMTDDEIIDKYWKNPALKSKTPSSPVSDLASEAKKYGSAEEFINELPVGGKEGREAGRGLGYYLADGKKPISDSPEMVTIYRGIPKGQKTSLVDGDYISTNKNSASAYGEKVDTFTVPKNQLYKAEGKDDLIFFSGKTKSQLTEIWNKANQK